MRYHIVDKFLLSLTVKPLGVCLYGSYFSGEWNRKRSDVDLIVFIPGRNIRRHETQIVEGVEVHIAFISLDILEDDVNHQKYGYLYISKFINPHIFLIDEDHICQKVIHLASKYLEDYCFIDIFNKPLTIDQIIARVLLTHLNNFPHYAIKLTKLSKDKDTVFNFKMFRNSYRNILKHSKKITYAKGQYNFRRKSDYKVQYRAYYHEKLRMTWWQTYQDYRNQKSFLVSKIESYNSTVEKLNNSIVNIINYLRQTAYGD